MAKIVVNLTDLQTIQKGIELLHGVMVKHNEKVMYKAKGKKRIVKIMLLCNDCGTDKNIQGCEDGIVICSSCNKQPLLKRLKDYIKSIKLRLSK